MISREQNPMTRMKCMWLSCFGLMIIHSLVFNAAGKASGAVPVDVAVVVSPAAAPLEKLAANELCKYLEALYCIKTRPTDQLSATSDVTLLIGSSETNPHVSAALGQGGWPAVSDQGIVLKRAKSDGEMTLVVGGGSPIATLWSVYELVERWGVRYLLDGDVIPDKIPSPSKAAIARGESAFPFPAQEVVQEPNLRVRQWRVINDLAIGPESWGMADYEPLLDQLAKLKFNRIYLSIYPWQPFVHLDVQGVKRTNAWLWYDMHYPITDDMPGRWLFGDGDEFWNPDLPRGVSYEEFSAAAEQLVHNIIDYAHARGMESAITASLFEYPPEFKSILKDSQPMHQLGKLTIVPGPATDIEDPTVTELASAVLRSTVNTYPEVDFIMLWAPEFRQWIDTYQESWDKLDARYGINSRMTVEDAIKAASNRIGYAGGTERPVREVKGDIVSLYFCDRLLRDLKVMQSTKRPDMKFVYGAVSEELFPVLPKILPPGSELLSVVDYTPSRIAKRLHSIANLPGREISSSLIYTLHDDNIGVLPQLMTPPLHELTVSLRQNEWQGFCTRYWLISDHDPCVAYIARAAWDASATPKAVYRDQIEAVCGKAAVEDMLTALQEIETTTASMEQHAMGLTFPVPGMIMKHWRPDEVSEHLIGMREGYQRALNAARFAHAKSTQVGRGYTGYWLGRLEFGIGFVDTIESVRRAARAEQADQTDQALEHTEEAIRRARQALESYARSARNRSDVGSIAVMGEYVYRPLMDKLAEIAAKN